jgi:Ca2+-transporting ATPase
MAHVLAIKSGTESLVRTGLLSNPLLAGAVVLTIALQLALIYMPAARAVFSTLPLSVADLGLCAGAGAVIVLAVECEKWVIRRRGVV